MRKKGSKGVGLNEQRKTDIRDALCNILTMFLIILVDFGGTLSHVLRESMAWSRNPLEGREVKVSIWLEHNLIGTVSLSSKDMSIVGGESAEGRCPTHIIAQLR